MRVPFSGPQDMENQWILYTAHINHPLHPGAAHHRTMWTHKLPLRILLTRGTYSYTHLPLLQLNLGLLGAASSLGTGDNLNHGGMRQPPNNSNIISWVQLPSRSSAVHVILVTHLNLHIKTSEICTLPPTLAFIMHGRVKNQEIFL